MGDLFGGEGDREGDGRRFSFESLLRSIFFFFGDLLKKLGRTIEMTQVGANRTGCGRAYI